MASIALDRIEKRFGLHQVIRGISAEIDDGEFVALVGPSGCGKSTVLRMIAGLEDVSAGAITIGGRVVNDVPPMHRNIAMVFQSYALYPHMTVADNMRFALKLRRFDAAEIERRVARVADMLHIGELLDRYPKQLSGGQRQRVAMGRAIVRDPEVFLFDEPLSNLDAALRVRMRSEIKLLHQQFRVTTVYVTHDQVEAMTMADKIVVLRDGRIEQIGSPLDLYDRPANLFVAGFIGSPAMNFIEGRIETDPASRFVASNGAIIALRQAVPDSMNGRRALLGIRPEDFEIDADKGLPSPISLVEPTGADIHVLAEFAGTGVTAAFRHRPQLQAKSVIPLTAPIDKIHLFDAEDHSRLSIA
ncbi:MAG: sn-glycerol-3-phosphate ABC transporter ATP-binding protein UgpC [Ancalomicrobiaceae bacterium]|nr:sn-glycerol-3-phosphate ABC transporter ATP-binding protein UgpC [Ancalomicrobiaceae bacterium]